MIKTRSLAAALVTMLGGSALAQTPPPAAPGQPSDRMQMVACLRQSGAAAASSCIGLVAVSCVRAATGDRRDAEADCARREEAVWRERLNLLSQVVMRSSDPGVRGQFAALQLAWEGYIAQKCAFYGSLQPPARAAGMQAGCMLREVANRSLELERMAGQRAPARRPSNPPSIIR